MEDQTHGPVRAQVDQASVVGPDHTPPGENRLGPPMDVHGVFGGNRAFGRCGVRARGRLGSGDTGSGIPGDGRGGRPTVPSDRKVERVRSVSRFRSGPVRGRRDDDRLGDIRRPVRPDAIPVWVVLVVGTLAFIGANLISYASARAQGLGLDLGPPTLASKGTRMSAMVIGGTLSPFWVHGPFVALCYLALHSHAVLGRRLIKASAGIEENER